MHIYFAGIGGSGLYPLALMASDCGFDVSGSDAERTDVTKQLESRDVTVGYAQDGTYIAAIHEDTPIDWIVASSAIPQDSPELAYAYERNIRVSKRDEFISWIVREKEMAMVAVSGTHGKTSTTAMCVWALQQLNIPVSYVVGASVPFGPPGKYQENSRLFVYEADEYDRNFLHFSPEYSVITTFDYDHPDIYPTEDEYTKAFRQFASQSERVYTWDNVADTLDIASWKNVYTRKDTESRIELIGEHNRRNGSLALSVLRQTAPDVEEHDVMDIINAFPGSSRRMERIAEGIFSDYAHHPVEIAATLQAAQEVYESVVVVYQPHQNTRQYRVRDQYVRAFDGASRVYWLPTYLSREDEKLETLDQHQLMMYVDNTVDVRSANMDDDLIKTVKSHAENGNTVILMGAGSIDAWARQHFM